jgi:hypothetical protein
MLNSSQPNIAFGVSLAFGLASDGTDERSPAVRDELKWLRRERRSEIEMESEDLYEDGP